MYVTEKSLKNYFLLQTKIARKQRANNKDRENAAQSIQKCFRSWICRKQYTNIVLEQFDAIFYCDFKTNENITMKPIIQISEIITKFLNIYNQKRDGDRMEKLYKYLVWSLDSQSPVFSYIGLALVKYSYNSWICQIKKILSYCLIELENLYPEKPIDYKSILLRLNTLVSFTSTASWALMKLSEMQKLNAGMNQLCANIMGYLVNRGFYVIMKNLLIKGLCRKITTLQPIALMAIITLTLRPLLFAKMSDNLLSVYLVHIIGVPTLIYDINYVDKSSAILLFKQYNLFLKSIKFLSSEVNTKSTFITMEGNCILYLLANLVELGNLECKNNCDENFCQDFTYTIINLLQCCQKYVMSKQSNTTYWHPILGWLEQPEDNAFHEVIFKVKKQLSNLWTGKIITQLFCKPLQELIERDNILQRNTQRNSVNTNVFYKALQQVKMKKVLNSIEYYKFDSPEVMKIALVCSLYQTALVTLKEIKSIILTGLCYQEKMILYNLWIFLRYLGPNCGLKIFLDHFAVNTKSMSAEFKMLILFCECMTHFITILDDIEMYEHQDLFKISDFILMSDFLNQFLYKAVINHLFDEKSINDNMLFTSLHTLLITIYRRDCQKKFCPVDHWLAKLNIL